MSVNYFYICLYNIYIYLFIYIYIFVIYIYICLYIYIFVIYIYLYIYICLYIYIYLFIYIYYSSMCQADCRWGSLEERNVSFSIRVYLAMFSLRHWFQHGNGTRGCALHPSGFCGDHMNFTTLPVSCLHAPRCMLHGHQSGPCTSVAVPSPVFHDNDMYIRNSTMDSPMDSGMKT